MMYETDETLTIKIIDVINEHNLTVEDIMEMTEYTKPTITKFFKGKHVGGTTICTIWNKLKNNGYTSNYKWNGYQEVKC